MPGRSFAPPPKPKPGKRLWGNRGGGGFQHSTPEGYAAVTIKDIQPRKPKPKAGVSGGFRHAEAPDIRRRWSYGRPAERIEPIPKDFTPGAVADDPKTDARLQKARMRERKKYADALKAQGELNFIEKAIRDVVFAPYGVYLGGAAVYGDISSGDYTARRTRAYGKDVAKSFAHSILHPTDDPFATALNFWGGIGVVGGVSSRLAAFGSTAAKGGTLRTALLRPGYEGGSLLRAPAPGRFDLKVGEGKVGVPLSRNPAYRQFQKGRLALTQRTLDKGFKGEGRKVPKHAVWVPREFSSQASFGRQLRASRRIEFDLRRAPYHLAEPDLRWIGKRVELGNRRFIHKVDPARNNAVAAIAIFGKEALKNPAGAVARMRATHTGLRQQILTELADPKITRNQRADLRLQLKAQDQLLATLPAVEALLIEQSPGLLKAATAAHLLSREAETELIALGLDPEIAAGRTAAMRAEYEPNAYYVTRGQGPPEGAFYFPMREEYVNPVQPAVGVGQGGAIRTQQLTGKPPPQPFPALQGFTGYNLRWGLPSLHQALPDRFLRIQRLRDTVDFFTDLYAYSNPVKTGAWDVPLRTSAEALPALRRAVADAQRHFELDPDFQGSLPDNVLHQIDDALRPKGTGEVAVGTAREGVVWVDGRFIKNMTGVMPSGRGGWMALADAINNPIRITTLYLRPAYALNALGNTGMALVTQGHMAPGKISQAFAAKSIYGPESVAQLKSLAGEGRSVAYSVETGFAHRTAQQLAYGWNKVTDEWFRLSSVIYNAERLGYKGKKGVKELFRRDEAGRYVHMDDITEIGRRSRQDAVDFNSLTPFERETLKHIVYFYPWMSRGTVWAGRALREHPIKSAVLANMGQDAGEKAMDKFGTLLPDWALRSGLFPVGDSRTVNPASVWTPTTAAQVGSDVANLAKGAIGVSHGEFSQATPFFEGLLSAFSDSEGQPPGQRSGLFGAATSIPHAAAIARSGLTGIFGPGPVTFPERGLGPALGPLVAGGLYARKTDFSQFRRQRARGGSAAEKARQDLLADYQAKLTDLERAGLSLAPVEETVYGQAYMMSAALAAATANKKTNAEKVRAALQLNRRFKLLQPAEVAAFRAELKTATEATAGSLFTKLQGIFGGNVRSRVSEGISAALAQKGLEPTEVRSVR